MVEYKVMQHVGLGAHVEGLFGLLIVVEAHLEAFVQLRKCREELQHALLSNIRAKWCLLIFVCLYIQILQFSLMMVNVWI